MLQPASMSHKMLDHTTGRRRVSEVAGVAPGSRQVIKRTIPPPTTGGYTGFRDADMLRNEARAIEYVRHHTTIPVPTVISMFEDRGCVYMVQEYVEGTVNGSTIRLSVDAKAEIISQLEGFVGQLHALTDPRFRSFVGAPFLPPRFHAHRLPLEHANYRSSSSPPYVLCHGDLSWQNLLIDPETYEIKCVIDWEYASFCPVEMEKEDWRRPDPYTLRKGESSDVVPMFGMLLDLAVKADSSGDGEVGDLGETSK